MAGVGCRWCTLPDPTYTAALSASMRTLANTIITNTGAKCVVWLTLFDAPKAHLSTRTAQWNALLASTIATTPHSAVVDVAGWIASTGESARLLPDGTHPSHAGDNTAAEIWQRFLLPSVRQTLGPGGNCGN